MYKETLDHITEYFARERYLSELHAAREEYFQRTGKVFEDEPMYESRMNAFQEWFVFDRPLKDSGVPPVRLYSEAFRDTLRETEARNLSALERTRHSLFELLSADAATLRARDLFGGETFDVASRPIFAGIHRGDLIDARLIPLEGENLFSEVYLVHPAEARGYILKRVRTGKNRSRSEFLDLVLDLANMKLRSERYKHLPPSSIYSDNPIISESPEAKVGGPS